MSGHRKDPKRARKKKPLSHGWTVVPSKSYRDRVYFYNVISKCSTWINPCKVLDDSTSSENSEISVESRNQKSFNIKLPRKRTSSGSFVSFKKEITEMEDCNKQDSQYLYNSPLSNSDLSYNFTNSSKSSPNSVFSVEINKSDMDTSKNSMILESDKKELWLHFASSPKNNNLKKSLALSDFEQPSTSSGVQKERQLLSGDLHRDDFKEPKIDMKIRSRKSKRRKRSRKGEGGKFKKEDKQNREETLQNVSSMLKDKTPAQSKMLKFRREYSEKIKKLINSSVPFKCKLDKIKNGITDCSSNTSESCSNCIDFSNNRRLNAESNKSLLQEEEVSNNDLSEEMDWEPSSEESDVRNINEFRQQQDKCHTNSNSFCELNIYHKTTLPSQTQDLILVLDTNIFVSCLNFVEELRDTKIRDLSYPIIYVPWRVLQELDHLKDSKMNGMNKQLLLNVRKAISFLNENFKFKHPRIFGQSFEDFNQMMDFNNFAPDDEILQTCLQLKKRHLNINLVLLTNDKNLESKANVSGVKVFSKESFEKNYLNHHLSSPTHSDSSRVTVASQSGIYIDNYVCEIKALLKKFLSMLVETEMRVAFEEDWMRVIHVKPPWTTKEALTCFLKHWRSVFFLVFSRNTLTEAENLNEKLFNKELVSMKDISEIISTFQRFIESIVSCQKKKRPYLDLSDSILTKLSFLLKETTLKDAPQNDSRMRQKQFPLISTSGESFAQAQPNTIDEITPLDISKVKNLFRDIWESLRCFCCSTSDVLNSPNPASNASLPDLRLKLVQILNEIGALISSIEKILEINPPDINEHHPLIIHFSMFLSNLYPAINTDLQNKLPKCLAAFFTDYEGRSLLSRSLIDFREFSQELIKISEFFKAQFV